jgi:lysozyme
MQINPLVVDLSHWDPADDYDAVLAAGVVGVIYKATEGGGYQDPTYVAQQHAAKDVGLRWGSYHFADGSGVSRQIDNYLRYACPDPDELLCLDWEDNGGDTMSLTNVKIWVEAVETALGRHGECVIYGGNTIKENGNGDPFLTSRRLWLCQYGDKAVLPEGYERYWLWQFTDGVYGPLPHAIEGIGPCDINHYDGDVESLLLEWASGKDQVEPEPTPVDSIVNVIVAAPRGVTVKVREVSFDKVADRRHRRSSK